MKTSPSSTQVQSTIPRRICITGANAGVGYDAARQLALLEGVETIILACRNAHKAQIAKESLEQQTDNRKCNFEVLIMDISNLTSVEQAVDSIDEPLDCLILNAGGFAGNDTTNLTDNGTMKIFDLNVLGSVHLTDLLIQQQKLAQNAQVLYISSETSRGIRGLNTPHEFKDNGSVDEMKSLCTGSCYSKPPSDTNVYGRVKLMGNLWTGSMARQHPEYRFVAVSPGNTAGTNVVQNMRLPSFARQFASEVGLPLMVMAGRFHPVEVGAQRYVDVLQDDETYESGHFYGTARNHPNTGPMADQQRHMDFLYSKKYQDNANTAIHSFLPTIPGQQHISAE